MSHNNLNEDEMSIHRLCYSGSRSGSNIFLPNVCAAYCDCEFPTPTFLTCFNGHIPDLIKCVCGEDDPATHTLQWNWHHCSESDTVISGPNVTFHPIFSQGTAIVRGDKPLASGMTHFWEMRILTPLWGTDVMFGIGTDKVDLTQFKFHFVSALGTNAQSWGFSFDGRIHHNGVHLKYGQKFSQGCIVGVLLDRVRGQLEYFLNRRSLGVAYTNIPNDPNIQIYPMVCSTAAKSCIRLMNAISQLECLQLRSFSTLAKQPRALDELRQLPGLKTILNNYWFLAPPIRYSRESKSNECDMLDEAVLSSKSRLSRKHNHKDDEMDDINDLYSNAHKIGVTYPKHEHEDDFIHMLL